MKPGTHGSTFGGNPLAMSAGNAVVDVLFRKGFLKNVTINGKYFQLHLSNHITILNLNKWYLKHYNLFQCLIHLKHIYPYLNCYL